MHVGSTQKPGSQDDISRKFFVCLFVFFQTDPFKRERESSCLFPLYKQRKFFLIRLLSLLILLSLLLPLPISLLFLLLLNFVFTVETWSFSVLMCVLYLGLESSWNGTKHGYFSTLHDGITRPVAATENAPFKFLWVNSTIIIINESTDANNFLIWSCNIWQAQVFKIQLRSKKFWETKI